MPAQNIHDWIDEQWNQAEFWWIKRLSASDTLAMGERNAGPRIPSDFLLKFLPELDDPQGTKPKMDFVLKVDSGDDEIMVATGSVVVHVGRRESRNLGRVTNWGGAANSLLDPENTGAVAAFTFHKRAMDNLPECHVWVCANLAEEEGIEVIWGSVEPGIEILSSITDERREIRFSN